MTLTYPSKIEKLMEIWRPYGKEIYKGNTQNVPKKALTAYEECKKWAWENQEQ